MAWPHRLQLLDVHCEGEIGKVIIGGAPDIPGATVAQMLDHINKVDDSLRRFVVLEPRGAAAGSVNLLLPPTRPDADAGFIVLQPDQAHAMSGSNAMCVVTALLETGRVAMTEPETVVRLDTAAGLVSATAECHDGRCRRVRLDMVPAFVEALDLELATEDWGPIKADICFGGIFYALVDVDQIGLKIEPDQARALVEAGMALKGLITRASPTSCFGIGIRTARCGPAPRFGPAGSTDRPAAPAAPRISRRSTPVGWQSLVTGCGAARSSAANNNSPSTRAIPSPKVSPYPTPGDPTRARSAERRGPGPPRTRPRPPLEVERVLIPSCMNWRQRDGPTVFRLESGATGTSANRFREQNQ
jgi:hypothetical protein